MEQGSAALARSRAASNALPRRRARHRGRHCTQRPPDLPGSHGLANVEERVPFTAKSAFRVCSISKRFLCALVWKAHRAGKLDVNAHPARFVSGFSGMEKSLTLAHLMQNRSGFRDHWVLAMWMGARAERPFTLADREEGIRRAPKHVRAG